MDVLDDLRVWNGLAPEVGGPLARALDGHRLSRDEACRLIRASASELPALMFVASILRQRDKGNTVTYSRKVFIPLTNLCRDKCGYCTFAKAPNHPEARTMEPEEVVSVARAGRAAGCKEALFSLGEKPEERYARARRDLRRLGYSSTIEYLMDMCDLVHRETGLVPHSNCGVMTREEMLALREVNGSMGLMLESVSDRLLAPGGAHYGCVGKVPATRLETIAMAGELRIPFTTGILIGIGETLEERVDSLFAIRELHERYSHIQEVIIQNFRAKPDIRMRHWPEPSVLDMLRTIAVARLVLGGAMNIQAPPNLMPDGCQTYLLAGINDWGGVSPVTKDHINPELAWPAIGQLRQATMEAGLQLRERLCLYPEYVMRPEFVRPRFRADIAAWTDQDGLVKEEKTQW